MNHLSPAEILALYPHVPFDKINGHVYDIDDSLVDTTPQYTSVMYLRKPIPELLLDPGTLRRRFGYQLEDLPGWLRHEHEEWFTTRRNCPLFNGTIRPMPGAAQVMQYLHERWPTGAYLTAREDTHEIRLVTATYLYVCGFPPAPLIMRPQNLPMVKGSTRWKADGIRSARLVPGVFDDRAEIALELGPTFSGKCILIGEHPEDILDKVKDQANVIFVKGHAELPAIYHEHFPTP